MEMEDEIKTMFRLGLSVFASLCYTYFISSEIPKGKLRLLSLFPILCLFFILPLSLSTALPAGLFAFFITWVGSFKLLLFSFGLGPLSSRPPPNSLLLFIFMTCLPIKTENPFVPNPKKPQNPSPVSGEPPKISLNFPTKVLLFAVLNALTEYNSYVHPNILLAQYCCMFYLSLDIFIGSCNVIMRAVLGIELESPSDDPYLSTSLQDFWGRRWNLTITNSLRHTVYNPVRSAAESLVGIEWAQLPAVLAAFVVSGLMHELIYFYMTRATPTWEVTMYFVLHGVCLVVEVVVKKAISPKWRLHWVLSIPLTIGFVVSTAIWLFFPPVMRNGIEARINGECKELAQFLMVKFKLDRVVWPTFSSGD